MKHIISFILALGACTSASATAINFTAIVANNLQGLNGADLASTDLVEVGTWDGSVFSSLGSTASDSAGYGAGFFQSAVNTFNSSATAGSQIAFQWSEAASGLTGLVYLDATADTNWSLKGGDGGGTDFNQNNVELADLTDSTNTTLLSGATMIGATFAGSNYAAVPSFQLTATAVPEPSTYAMLSGLCVLGFAALRRRRA